MKDSVTELLLGKQYKFENCREYVLFTPLEDVLSQDEIMRIKRLQCELHQCHSNSVRMTYAIDCQYCEGVIVEGHVIHSFNRLIRNGKTYYIDVTDWVLRQRDKRFQEPELSLKDVLLMRVYHKKEIRRLAVDFEHYFVTIDPFICCTPHVFVSDEGIVVKINGSEYSEIVLDRIRLFSEKKKEYEKGLLR